MTSTIGRQQILVVEEFFEVKDRELEGICPDCDCLLEQFYDESGNSKYICDNCGTSVRNSVTTIAE
jgi:hypothetical protein